MIFTEVLKPDVVFIETFTVPVLLPVFVVLGLIVLGYSILSMRHERHAKNAMLILAVGGLLISGIGVFIGVQAVNDFNAGNSDGAVSADSVAVSIANEFSIYNPNLQEIAQWVQDGSQDTLLFTTSIPTETGLEEASATLTVVDGKYVYDVVDKD